MSSNHTDAWQRANERPHAVIVSDDPDLREFLGQGLLMTGFWTSAIASGIQVLEVFRLRRFDLVLLDGGLSGLSAPDVLRRLRSGGRGGMVITDAPVVIVAPVSADRDAYHQIGVDAILEPPYDLPDVAVRLHGIVKDWRDAHPGVRWSDAPPAQADPDADRRPGRD
ncbi:MAG TPA: response regulator [Thermomicrobiales bacterium]|jgi:DNA-binding response OmpR family regulator|nr:response regulator [Thermomicrobiales bacterium]